jgi:anti-sigma regulatory factor (Ser/Thr protein kinase)
VATGESIPDTLRLSLSGPDAVHAATSCARDFATVHDIGEAAAARLAIAVEELVTNLFDHGRLGAGDAIELSLSRSADAVSMTIIDQGTPFDPRSATQPASVPDRGGGAGLALVRAWAIESNYEVGEHGNRLTISLPIDRR